MIVVKCCLSVIILKVEECFILYLCLENSGSKIINFNYVTIEPNKVYPSSKHNHKHNNNKIHQNVVEQEYLNMKK